MSQWRQQQQQQQQQLAVHQGPQPHVVGLGSKTGKKLVLCLVGGKPLLLLLLLLGGGWGWLGVGGWFVCLPPCCIAPRIEIDVGVPTILPSHVLESLADAAEDG